MATAVTSRLAFYDLRDYWLSDNRVAELLDLENREEIDGVKIKPFFPSAQQPETKFPYARYNVKRIIGYPQWWMHTEIVGIELYAVNLDVSNELINIFIDMAGRLDSSADELERWIAAEGRDRHFEYHHLEWVDGGDMEAPGEEGGAIGRPLNFAISYSPLKGRGIV